MNQMIESMQNEIRRLETEVKQLDEKRKEKRATLTMRRKALKLWTGAKTTRHGTEATA